MSAVAFASLCYGTSAAASAAAGCKLAKLAEFPVTMVGMRPVIPAKINGVDAHFIVDSGAFYSTMSAPAARGFGLPLSPLPFHYGVIGVGGTVDMSLGMVKKFEMANIQIQNIGFLVGGSEIGADGLLGQNVLGIGDVEYDLARGTVRLMRADDNCATSTLAYWVPSGEAYSVMPISYATRNDPHTTGYAFLNGVKIRVTFDTGATYSALSLKAAERAGIKIDSPGVKSIGYSHGLGSKLVMTYSASFTSIKIGDEEIDHAHLRFGDVGIDTDMLIGADFFLSHHVYVSNKQHRLYFTYNGGPVFDLRTQPIPENTATPEAVTADQTTPRANGGEPPAGKEPSSEDRAKASELSRRGLASLARQDFASALSDLSNACELAPEPAYFVQLGGIHETMHQDSAAAADYANALRLRPGFRDAVFARAHLEVRTGDKVAAVKDFDEFSTQISPNDSIHLHLGEIYLALDEWKEALEHFNIWLAAHDDDGSRLRALAGRCAARGYLNIELTAAVKDCNQALKLFAKKDSRAATVYTYRGLAYLQQGDYERSIADYSVALQMKANDTAALYGRGIAEIRSDRAAAGNADVTAAMTHDPAIGARFQTYGVVPASSQ